MVMKSIFLGESEKKEAPPSLKTHKPSGLIFGIMGFVPSKEEGGAYDPVYQTIHYQTTIFNDKEV